MDEQAITWTHWEAKNAPNSRHIIELADLCLRNFRRAPSAPRLGTANPFIPSKAPAECPPVQDLQRRPRNLLARSRDARRAPPSPDLMRAQPGLPASTPPRCPPTHHLMRVFSGLPPGTWAVARMKAAHPAYPPSCRARARSPDRASGGPGRGAPRPPDEHHHPSKNSHGPLPLAVCCTPRQTSRHAHSRGHPAVAAPAMRGWDCRAIRWGRARRRRPYPQTPVLILSDRSGRLSLCTQELRPAVAL